MEYIEDSHLFTPAAIGMFKIFVIALLVIHILGGLWYFIGDSRGDGLSWLSFWKAAQGLDDPPLLDRYFASVYFICTTLTTTVRLPFFRARMN